MKDDFTNDQINISDLPTVNTLNLIELNKDYLTAKMIRNLIFWLVILVVTFTVYYTKVDELPKLARIGIPTALIIIMFFQFIMTYFGFKKKFYALREKDILFQTGLLWRTKTVIPFNRIQHAEVIQGPIDRMFDLSVLRIFTAGGSASDMNLPGLRPIEANNIKEFILGKTSADEEE